MTDEKSSYRDELAAAHARIADLEERLARSIADFSDPAEPWLAKLSAERAEIVGRNARYFGLGAEGLFVLVLFGAVIPGLLIARSTLGIDPVTASALSLGFAALLFFALRFGVRRQTRQELAKVDEKIDEVKRTVAIAREPLLRARVAGAGLRVAEPPMGAAEDESDPALTAESRKR